MSCMPRRVKNPHQNPHSSDANHPINQPFDSLNQPLLPSSNFEFNPTAADDLEFSVLRTELSYYFLSPIQKCKITGSFPYTIFVQSLKILVVTAQLILLGSLSSTRVSYGERTQLTFKHLYLYHWDSQYETLPYPPSTGTYALYSREEFYEAVGFVMRQFNRTEKESLNSYRFLNNTRQIKICLEQFDEICRSRISSQSKSSVCRTFNLTEISAKDVDVWTNTEKFLNSNGLSIDFARFHCLSFSFSLLSPPIHHSDWDMSIECFQFEVDIHFVSLGQTGQVTITLHSEPIEVSCFSVDKSPHEESLTSRRITHLIIDLLAFNISFVSLMISVHQTIRGVKIWKRTKCFFSEHFGICLSGLFYEFVSPWIFCVIKGDLLILVGSASKLVNNRNILNAYATLSYMLGLGTLLLWLSVLRYIELSSQTHVGNIFFKQFHTKSIIFSFQFLLRTIKRCVPGLFRFLACALVLFFAFVFPAWVILGPFNMKFRSFTSTLECLFSLINGDDMYVTFSIIDRSQGIGIFLFSRVFLYVFITLFIYAVLNIFVTIIFEAYEETKEDGEPEREEMKILKRFLAQHEPSDHVDLHSERQTRVPWRRLSSSIASSEFDSAAVATSTFMESSTEIGTVPVRPMQPEMSFTCIGVENKIEEQIQSAGAGDRSVF